MQKSINQSSDKVFFPNLDGLRFIAFFLVFMGHAFRQFITSLEYESTFIKRVVYNLFQSGNHGVSIFFVLSGFLITYLILTEINFKGKLDVPAFYKRRFLRIWPLYFAVLLFVFVLLPFIMELFSNGFSFANRPFLYFVFLGNFDVIYISHHFYNQDTLMASITWSVAIEEQFYLVWPLLFFFIPKRFYPAVFFSIIILCYTFRYIYMNDVYILYFHTFAVFGDLAMGGLFAYYALFNQRFLKFFAQFNRFASSVVVMLLLGIIMFSTYFISSPYWSVFNRLFFSFVFVLFIMDQNFNRRSLFKLSKGKFITKWGKYTYGLYLLHPIAINITSNSIKPLIEPGKVQDLVIGVTSFFVSLAISYMSYHLLEKYFLKLKKRFTIVKSYSHSK